MSATATRYALIFGGLGGALAIAGLIASFSSELRYVSSVWFGYLVMLVALTLLFAGVKRYRDVECGGVISFGRAFGVGLGIALVATLTYAIGWEIYQAATGFDFVVDYGSGVVERMREDGASAAAIAAKRAEIAELGERYRDPLFRVPMTMVEILPVGLLVAAVSAGLLRNSNLLPARRMA